MRNDFYIWAALTLLAAGIAIAVLFQSSLVWFSIGAVVVILLLALRDNLEGANRLGERENALQSVAKRLDCTFESGSVLDFNVLGWGESFRLTEKAVRAKSLSRPNTPWPAGSRHVLQSKQYHAKRNG